MSVGHWVVSSWDRLGQLAQGQKILAAPSCCSQEKGLYIFCPLWLAPVGGKGEEVPIHAGPPPPCSETLGPVSYPHILWAPYATLPAGVVTIPGRPACHSLSHGHVRLLHRARGWCRPHDSLHHGWCRPPHRWRQGVTGHRDCPWPCLLLWPCLQPAPMLPPHSPAGQGSVGTVT